MNKNIVWATVLLAASSFTVALVTPAVEAAEPVASLPGVSTQPGVVGMMVTCNCQGAGRVATCSGSSCECSYDWQGYPRCSATGTLLL